MHNVRVTPFLVALLLAACVGEPGEPGSGAHAITGGQPESGYPAVFALAYDGQGGCTGTCIAPTVGLTAAHCVQGDTPETLTALFGNEESSPTKVVQVTEIAIEPSGADIAILRFAEACPATTPFNQTALEAHVGQPVVMVGFGVTTEQANDAGIKRSGTATLFSVSPAEVNGMQAGELATSNVPDGTCNGDSGGPTFMTFGGTQYVVGVTARGSIGAGGQEEPCGSGRSIAVRADSYASFIAPFVGGGDGAVPGGAGPGEDGMPGSGGESPGTEESAGGGCQIAVAPSTAWSSMLLLGLAALVARRRRTF